MWQWCRASKRRVAAPSTLILCPEAAIHCILGKVALISRVGFQLLEYFLTLNLFLCLKGFITVP